MRKRFAVLGCLEETRDTLQRLAQLKLYPDQLIGLSPQVARRQQISNYVDLAPVAQALGIPYTPLHSYTLKTAADLELFRQLTLDLLVVVGWQRLLPAEILECISIGALGFHGSCNILPWGRGRSPINWSIIEGRDRFALHMFFLTPGVDDGPVVGIKIYDINPYDTCRSIYYKTALAQAELIATQLPQLLTGRATGMPQVGEPFYYPKRTPDDGHIDWTLSADEICRLVRAVTWPYPGAFSWLDAQKAMIWAAQPFSRDFFPGAAPGQICFVPDNGRGEFVVRCGDGCVLVTEYQAEVAIIEGAQLA